MLFYARCCDLGGKVGLFFFLPGRARWGGLEGEWCSVVGRALTEPLVSFGTENLPWKIDAVHASMDTHSLSSRPTALSRFRTASAYYCTCRIARIFSALGAHSFPPELRRAVKGKGRGGWGSAPAYLPALGGTPSFPERFSDGLQAVESPRGQRSTLLSERKHKKQRKTARWRVTQQRV